MIYSKTYCPYCSRAKALFEQLNVEVKVAELDVIGAGWERHCRSLLLLTPNPSPSTEDGSEVQKALKVITGSGTVPQIFVGGEFLGGCSEVTALHQSKQLLPKLDKVGVKHA